MVKKTYGNEDGSRHPTAAKQGNTSLLIWKESLHEIYMGLNEYEKRKQYSCTMRMTSFREDEFSVRFLGN